MFRKYRVKIRGRDKMLGGIPKSDDLVEPWLQARIKKGVVPEGEKAFTQEEIDNIVEEAKSTADLIEEETEQTWSGFKTNGGGPYIDAINLKAMFREAATVLRITKQRGCRQLIQHGLFIRPEIIEFGKEKPDGYIDRCGHVMGPMGPRSILQRNDYIQNAELEFEVWISTGDKDYAKWLSEENVVKALTHAQELGLGASRSQGYGTFDIVSFEQI